MSTPTISDPGFEIPQVGGGNFQIAPSGSPWTFTGTGGVAANGSAINSGIANAPEGGQACLIQGIGSASQAVAGWEAGTYKLTLFGAQRYGQRNDINILVDGQVVAHYQPVVVADEQGNEVGYFFSEHTTPEFTVAAGSHTIKFQGLNTAGGDNCCFLDAVSLTQVSAGGGMQPAALTAGAVATSAVTATGLTLTVASIAGGVEPYSIQFQQAPDAGNAPGTWANLGTAGAATTKVVTVAGVPGTKYWFRASVTDSAGTPATATTAAVSATTAVPPDSGPRIAVLLPIPCVVGRTATAYFVLLDCPAPSTDTIITLTPTNLNCPATVTIAAGDLVGFAQVKALAPYTQVILIGDAPGFGSGSDNFFVPTAADADAPLTLQGLIDFYEGRDAQDPDDALDAVADRVDTKLAAKFAAIQAAAGNATAAVGSLATSVANGVALKATGLDAIPIDTNVNARQALAINLAAAAGTITGAGVTIDALPTGQAIVKMPGTGATVITAQMNKGQRSTVTLSTGGIIAAGV